MQTPQSPTAGLFAELWPFPWGSYASRPNRAAVSEPIFWGRPFALSWAISASAAKKKEKRAEISDTSGYGRKRLPRSERRIPPGFSAGALHFLLHLTHPLTAFFNRPPEYQVRQADPDAGIGGGAGGPPLLVNVHDGLLGNITNSLVSVCAKIVSPVAVTPFGSAVIDHRFSRRSTIAGLKRRASSGAAQLIRHASRIPPASEIAP